MADGPYYDSNCTCCDADTTRKPHELRDLRKPYRLAWGFIFTLRGETVPKHPTQLYEAIAYFAIFIVLILIYKNFLPKLKRGTLFALFLISMFSARFFIEFVKEPQVAFEQGMSLNMGQWMSIPFIVGGILLLIYSIYKGKPAMIETGTKGTQTGSRGKK